MAELGRIGFRDQVVWTDDAGDFGMVVAQVP